VNSEKHPFGRVVYGPWYRDTCTIIIRFIIYSANF
jgi:hypothetical protein